MIVHETKNEKPDSNGWDVANNELFYDETNNLIHRFFLIAKQENAQYSKPTNLMDSYSIRNMELMTTCGLNTSDINPESYLSSCLASFSS